VTPAFTYGSYTALHVIGSVCYMRRQLQYDGELFGLASKVVIVPTKQNLFFFGGKGAGECQLVKKVRHTPN